MLLATLALLGGVGSADQDPPNLLPQQQTALETVDKSAPLIKELARKIWNLAEPAFQEHESSRLLAGALAKAGFRVTGDVAGMKTAFVAEYGSGKPVIAILAEYDALPGLAQAAVPYQEPIPRQNAGHGCGHNLFGAASVGAALAVKEAIDAHKLSGTIRLYGCPAEEGGGGKVYLVRAGLFRDVDAALHWHPSTFNDAQPHSCLAVIRFRAEFVGRAAHAAGSPFEGRSALDGVELMNVGVNYLREHIIPEARIHYVITAGGRRPNVVPDLAEVWYYIRAPKMSQALAIFERVKKVAEGASLMSETESKIKMVTGTYEILPNQTLAAIVRGNLEAVGPPKFSEQEVQFARALRQSLGLADTVDLATGAQGPVADRILDRPPKVNNGSTDVGDVSWNVPTGGLQIATAARGIPGHSWSFVACSGAPLGERGAIIAAKVLATSAVELFMKPETIEQAKREFLNHRPAETYTPVLGEEPPPDKLDPE